jgi:organic hydroperoxide reductase OsmC/OhrA
MSKAHQYNTQLAWTGNTGEGTRAYSSYERSHIISVENKPAIPGSSDPHFRGDSSRYNPEELLVASLSSCHMLWFLHMCSEQGIVVTAYEDAATGSMLEDADGGGRFTAVVLHPKVWVKNYDGNAENINALHAAAHKKCFIANSCNFPVKCEPVCYEAGESIKNQITKNKPVRRGG